MIVAALACSCSQKPEEVSTVPLPSKFSLKGDISVERYSYGGAMGGYRYYIYFSPDNENRDLIYKGKSNKLLSIVFPTRKSIRLNFCSPDSRQSELTSLSTWRGLAIERAC